MIRWFILFCIVCLCASPVSAQQAKTIRVLGRQEATVTTPQIRLEDIAEVSSELVQDDEAVIGLKKIWISASPEPAQDLTLSAQQVLERIKEQGVDLNHVGYTLPRVITIKRAGRAIGRDEIEQALISYITGNKKDLALKKIMNIGINSVSPGSLALKVESDANADGGKRHFNLVATINGQDQTRFPVTALVDEFREVPVASRSISKGSVVTQNDLVMARFNSSMLPKDAAEQGEAIVGLEATNDITAGEVFRNAKLALPLLVEAGAKVTMQYKSDLFEATATGVALESGSAGQEIKIRNETSKRIVPGTVMDTGIVRVK